MYNDHSDVVQGIKLSSQALISRRSSGRGHWTALILGPGTTVYGLKLTLMTLEIQH